jgi:hypothetical protein
MSPRKLTAVASPENPFEEAFINHQALVGAEPVENAAFFNSASSLETTGLGLVGTGQVNTERVAEVMHQVFTRVADLEVVPPLDEAQRNLVAGKVATYAALREVAQPKTRARSKPTNPTNIPTDKPKP